MIQGRVSPVPLKPRAPRSQEPTRNYENHTLARSTANTSAANGSAANSLTVNGDTNNEGLAYMSLSSCKSQAVSDTGTAMILDSCNIRCEPILALLPYWHFDLMLSKKFLTSKLIYRRSILF